MHQKIFFDTETTGLSAAKGDRICEIAAIKVLSDGSQQVFHRYLNPNHPVNPFAQAVHGLSNKRLASEPSFKEIGEDFCTFIRGGELIAHNAPFDVSFVEAELADAGLPSLEELNCVVRDTLVEARKRFPGQKNTLDALCMRFDIPLDCREQGHGALIDTQLLIQVANHLDKEYRNE